MDNGENEPGFKGRAPLVKLTRTEAVSNARTTHDIHSRTSCPKGFDVGNAACTTYMSLARKQPRLAFRQMSFRHLKGEEDRPVDGDRLENVKESSPEENNDKMSYVPSSPQGKKAVARLGRKKATGGFKRIENEAESEGKSPESAAKIAGAVYWKMARARRG